MPHLLVLFAVTILACVAFSCTASIYFVAPNGDDDNQGDSPNRPLKSIQLAVNKLRPGDTLLLLPGRYQQNFKTVQAGLPNAPIQIKGLGDVIINGSVFNRSYLISIKHSYIRLQGLEVNGLLGSEHIVNNFANKLIWVSSGTEQYLKGVHLKQLKVHRARGECIRFKRVAYSVISHNDISHCGVEDYVFNRGKQNGEAIYIGTAPEQLNYDEDASTHNHIIDNRIRVHGAECVDIKEGAAFNYIAHNLCARALSPNSGAISVRSSHNKITFNTVIDNVGAGIRIGGDSPGMAVNNIVAKNTLVSNVASGLKLMDWPQLNVCDNRILNTSKMQVVRVKKGIAIKPIERCNNYDF